MVAHTLADRQPRPMKVEERGSKNEKCHCRDPEGDFDSVLVEKPLDDQRKDHSG